MLSVERFTHFRGKIVYSVRRCVQLLAVARTAPFVRLLSDVRMKCVFRYAPLSALGCERHTILNNVFLHREQIHKLTFSIHFLHVALLSHHSSQRTHERTNERKTFSILYYNLWRISSVLGAKKRQRCFDMMYFSDKLSPKLAILYRRERDGYWV